MVNKTGDALVDAVRVMGAWSWLVLLCCGEKEARSRIEITTLLEELLAQADFPIRRMDPSTLSYALDGLTRLGLLEDDGQRPARVPGPRGSSRVEPRSFYRLTELGRLAAEHKRELDRVMSSGIRVT